MISRWRVALLGLTVVLVAAGCARPPGARTLESATSAQAPAGSSGPKRITAAIRGSPVSLVQQRTDRSGGSVRGLDGVEELVHAGLTYLRADGTRAALLAEAVPSLENGQWKLLPDGRMETTWKIKPSARWHDGTALTANDVLFTTTVEQDRELEIPPYSEYELIERIAAPDPATVVVTWKRPYIEGDVLFSYRAAGLPLPRHLLERAYADDKPSLLSLPYWSEEFVGAGAFRVQEWVRDAYTVLRASDTYVLGRPKITEIEVRFIPDNNALLSTVLAGLDLTLGKTISLDMALQARDQWKDGRMLTLPQNWTPLNPQFINPDPPIVGDVRFRRALLQALDRRQLADFVFSGQGQPADSYVGPDSPYYPAVDASIVKYAHDPAQAAQAIDGLGYTKRPDGFFYDPAGQKLGVSIFAPVQNDIHPKATAAVAAMWQQLGVAVEQVLIPPQRMQDREYVAQFPSFQMIERRNSLSVIEIWRLHSSSTQLPENRFRAPGTSRYRNSELDALLERYVTAIPVPERTEALAGIVHHMTENLSHLPLFFGVDPTMVSNRLVNVTARGDAFTQAWNVQEWDLR